MGEPFFIQNLVLFHFNNDSIKYRFSSIHVRSSPLKCMGGIHNTNPMTGSVNEIFVYICLLSA